jgi:hypothetical protein
MRRYFVLLAMVGGFMVSGTVAVAATTTGGGGLSRPGPGVSSAPVRNTPHLGVTKGGRVEEIRQLVQCGQTMYAAGSFSQIEQGGHIYKRRNVFSFRAISPFTVTAWAPRVNGTVNSITLSRNCSYAYLGGSFSSINGAKVSNIAKISTRTGAVGKRFAHRATAEVETLLRVRKHILVGGFFRAINGSSANPYMTSLNPNTGKNDGYLHLRISGYYHFSGAAPNRTRVYNQQPSHSGRFDLVEGDFTSVGGRQRRQIFMLKLGRRHASVTRWRSSEFNRHCTVGVPFYIQAASWSPDDTTVYIATTGVHSYKWNGSYPLTGLCDAAAAFPATHTSVIHKWINYTGCDSLYSTAADASTAYFGGHNRWSENPKGCNFRGPGAYSAPGMEGLSPNSGALYLNAKHSAGYYSRSRGYGADDMLRTQAGLWIASDNFEGSDMCGGVSGLAGICFLPDRG